MGAVALNPAAITFSAAIGAGVGVIAASFIHIPWLELPLMMMGLAIGGWFGFAGIDVMGGF